MYNQYKEYLAHWLKENTNEGTSPLSYENWCKNIYYKEEPTDREWYDLKQTYHRLTSIAKEIESVRLSLYTNRAHRSMNDNWKTLDEILFHAQYIIWAKGVGCFGSHSLEESVF